MPYFMWRGVDIKGRMQKGKLFARSEKELDSLLLTREIALLRHKIAHTRFARSITQEIKIHFFRQLASLMRAGLLVHDALLVLSPQISNPRFQHIIATIADHVMQGKQLSEQLKQYPTLFDTVTIEMIQVGQESGTLAVSADIVADHLQSKHQLNKQLRAGALMPGITFLFFFMVLFVIFVAVIPIFADLFASTGKHLPKMTQVMLSISSFLRSIYALVAIGIAIVFFLGIKWFAHHNKKIVDGFILQLPFFGRLTRKKSLVYFTQSLSLLLKGGMQLVPALAVAQKTVNNSILRDSLVQIEHDVTAGSSLSDACARQQEWFGQETVAMVSVGQESGQLGEMLHKVAFLHEERVKEALLFVTKVIQPLLMVFLGLLVTALLFSVYVPIFTLSQVIGG